MNIAKAQHVTREHLPVLGYFHRRKGKAICTRHGARDTDRVDSPWVEIRAGDRWAHPDHGTAQIRCHECGEWLDRG